MNIKIINMAMRWQENVEQTLGAFNSQIVISIL
jgi:hypothetical protein